MKLLDKLKNVFFEEVEEDEEEIPQTFAKKVEIPKRKKPDFKKFDEEISTSNSVKEPVNNVIKNNHEEVEIDPIKEEIEEKKIEPEKGFPMMFDESDFLEDDNTFIKEEEKPKDDLPLNSYKRENREYTERELYQGKKEVSYVESINNKPTYSYTKSYYEEKDTKGFKPSPIISPIYGILDKNYRKEEVITKRESRVTSTYKRPDLDTVRNKAFGSEEEKETKVVSKKETRSSLKEPENKKVYDVNNSKPQVNRVTLADADEYYNDLGLAYNVDYSDSSTNTTRSAKYSIKDSKKGKKDVDDNLFDLIDSMYNKED